METQSPHFPRLFEQAVMGGLKLKNRVVMLPMGTSYATPAGEVTDRTVEYYVERAKGGVGLITVGNISPDQPNALNQLVLDSDWVLMGQYELVEKVHAQGPGIVAQINHPGRQKYPESRTGEELVSSSPLSARLLDDTFPKPRELTRKEIFELIDQYVKAVARAKNVGYDMVELHGAHGYLINQFISSYMNHRTDEFGGSLTNRMRFPLEMIKEVRRAVGPDYPIGFRISAAEFLPGGITLEESSEIAKMLEAAGVTYLSVSAGTFETFDRFADLMGDPEGWKEYIWECIHGTVRIPVIAGGGLRHPDFCERILEQRKADFIGLARPLFADPEWPRKAMEGRPEDIRMCIFCNECLWGSAGRRRGGGARRCTVNAAAGREREFANLVPASVKKNVMVIGGGPAGLEAARVAGLRGHEVVLYEKEREAGGQLLLAGRPRSKRKILWVRDFLVGQLEKLGVEMKLGVTVTPGLVEQVKPDVVVVAAGAVPSLPDIPNAGRENVISGWKLLKGSMRLEKENVIVLGGGLVGCEVAEYLLETGNRVTILEERAALAEDMEPVHRFALLRSFRERGVAELTNRKALQIGERGVEVLNLEKGQNEWVQGDWIMVAVGSKPIDDLLDSVAHLVPEAYSAGDCNRPRVIMEAIYEGALAGRKI
jgi:2,4-dienoyl-CoA reductase-like NADH-dependent reductase (Old Yellow Enzyme family)/thioredoxin reductase